jgi:serine/threonine-protein kinase
MRMRAPIAVGTVIADKYRVENVLGEGGMGVVVRATHLVLQQAVAIKFLRRGEGVDPDAVKQFVGEAQAAARVQGDHVVRIYDVALLDDGTPYIVMEHLDGMSLANILADRGALSVHEAVDYASQVSQALVKTHAAGIVHGDLKPENIYVTGGGDTPRRIKLLDFGVSRILNGGGARPAGVVVGTPAYMAPEQFRAEAEPRSDLWAVGILLYEMLSGLPPFRADNFEAARELVASTRHAPLARLDVAPGLNEIIARCLEKKPGARYPSARELAAALEEHLPVESSIERSERLILRGRSSTSQRMAPTVVIANRRTGHGAWSWAALGVVAAVGVAITLVAVRGRSRPLPAKEPASALVASSPSLVPAELVPAGTTTATEPTPPEEQTAAPSPTVATTPPMASSTKRKRAPRAPRPTSTAEARRSAPNGEPPKLPEDEQPSADERYGTRK